MIEHKPVMFVVVGLKLGLFDRDVVYVPHSVPQDNLTYRGTEWVWCDCRWYTSRSGATWDHYYLYRNGRKSEIHRPVPIAKDPTFSIEDPRGGKLTNTGIYDEAIKLCEKVASDLSKWYGETYLLIDSCWECRVHYVLPEKVYIAKLGHLVFEQGNLRIYELEGLPEEEVFLNVTVFERKDLLEVYNHILKGHMSVYGSRTLRRGQMYIIDGNDLLVMSPDHGISTVSLNRKKLYLVFHPSPRRVED